MNTHWASDGVLTREWVEARCYTYVYYCQLLHPGGSPFFEMFLVPSPYQKSALSQAKEYLYQKGYQKINTHNIHLYPRNYIRKARQLFAEGKYYKPE